MTRNEHKRFTQAIDVLGQASRTEGERAAAQSIIDGIKGKVQARVKLATAYGLINTSKGGLDVRA